MTFDTSFATEMQVNSATLHATPAAFEPVSPDDHFEQEIDRLTLLCPEWVAEFDRLDPHVCHFQHVDDLYLSAPDDVARGIVLGIDMFRVQMEAVSGWPYRHGSPSSQLPPLQAPARPEQKVSAQDFADEYDALAQSNPEWLDQWDAVDPFVAPYSAVVSLLATAPGPVWRGLLIGIHSFRINLEAITGRAYKYEMGIQ